MAEEEGPEKRLLRLCARGFRSRGCGRGHSDRLRAELAEVENQGEHEYFLSLYDGGVRYPYNQNNLVIPYLLGVVDDFDLSKPSEEVMGDSPDIDVDFLKPVQVYLKDEWAPRVFGREHVCSVGSYTTFGLKSTLIDVARVFGYDRQEILSLTTSLGLKDEDGNKLTLDAALGEYPALRDYCERRPEVADVVRKLLHRNRGMGKHAGGLIISSRRIDDLVPLVRGSDDLPLSAWTEGQKDQDLGPMGLVKFDVLVTTNLMQIARAGRLAKGRHGLAHLWSDPEVNEDWSDDRFIDDPEALALARRADMLGVFQFDSRGIRNLCKNNVTSFNDLVAFNSLYRPGPLNAGMHETYVRRKNGRERYRLHPLLEPILGPTYGVYCYQEQVMQLLDVVGNIPPKHCLVALKGISKKKVEKFRKYKDKFLSNGKKNLGVTDEEINKLWDEIEGMSAYSFNKSHSCAYAYLAMKCLCLKAHYPIEFYTATLQCESRSDKIKEYIIDARHKGVAVEPVSLNLSKANFSIGPKGDSEAIYFGFGNLLGLGEGVAERIVASQPYHGFEDFLDRFGFEAKAVLPLLALGVFGEDRVGLYKFYKRYREWSEGSAARDKRQGETRERLHQRLRDALPEGLRVSAGFSEDHFEEYAAALDRETFAAVDKVRSRFHASTRAYAEKVAGDSPPAWREFRPGDFTIDEGKGRLLEGPSDEIETAYYGFRWNHPLEKSPDFNPADPMTFGAHRAAADDGTGTGPVLVEVEGVVRKPTKGGGVYYKVTASDVLGEQQKVNVWSDDFDRFSQDLVEGNLVKLTLNAPDRGFPDYKLAGPPRWLRHTLPRDRTMDFRVVAYAKPAVKLENKKTEQGREE